MPFFLQAVGLGSAVAVLAEGAQVLRLAGRHEFAPSEVSAAISAIGREISEGVPLWKKKLEAKLDKLARLQHTDATLHFGGGWNKLQAWAEHHNATKDVNGTKKKKNNKWKKGNSTKAGKHNSTKSGAEKRAKAAERKLRNQEAERNRTTAVEERHKKWVAKQEKIKQADKQRQSNWVRLIRVQKTGGTTFGEIVMTKMCGYESPRCSYLLHKEWKEQTDNGKYQGHLVAMLRHPVERTMSEFLFLRGIDGFICGSQNQWDFRDTDWMHYVQHEPSTEKALFAYLNKVDNPGRNRQSLYLLGFDRNAYDIPGKAYDWEADRANLTEMAKARLRTTDFGFTECFEPSVKAIARGVGWDEKAVLATIKKETARKTSQKERHAETANLTKSRVPDMLNVTFSLPYSTTWKHDKPKGTWRNLLSSKLVNYIENWNAVDMELYEYGINLFESRYGMKCRDRKSVV